MIVRLAQVEACGEVQQDASAHAAQRRAATAPPTRHHIPLLSLPTHLEFLQTVVKTLVKTLHPTQRREEATASRWVAALHRDPRRLAHLTDSMVHWARGVLKARKQQAAQQGEAQTVQMHASILGTASELDVPE
eukprot:1113035-Prymnesium_polylepis.1